MLKVKNLTKKYTKENNIESTIFKNFNLEVQKGEFISIFGPNGCGKSTLFNSIGNLITYNGSITFNDKKISEIKIGVVFQDYRNSLFPWMKIKDNIIFPLKIAGFSKVDSLKKLEKIKQKFKLDIDLNLYPYELSGGQQQLVSILRRIISEPELFLLDEPFASLDYQTTLFMMQKLLLIWQETQLTTLFISHEIDEAIFLSQKIILLSNAPTEINAIIENPLPYPRKPEIIGSKKFVVLKNKILNKYLKLLNK
jgi:NitT/TauT family transport system ATP-binding protein